MALGGGGWTDLGTPAATCLAQVVIDAIWIVLDCTDPMYKLVIPSNKYVGEGFRVLFLLSQLFLFFFPVYSDFLCVSFT